MTAEVLLQGPQLFCLTPEEALAVSSIPATNRVAATRKACFAIDSAYSEDIATITALDNDQWGRWANTHALYRQLHDVLPSNIKITRGVLGEVLGFGVNLNLFFQQKINNRLKSIQSIPVRSTVCQYTVTPSSKFIINTHPQMSNVLIASCCSGHGFKHSAALGEALAAKLLDKTCVVNLAPFERSLS